MDIGLKINTTLRKRGHTNEWLASKLNVSPQYIGAMLRRKSITTNTLEKISNALEVPMTYWFEDTKTTNTLLSELLKDTKQILNTLNT